MSLDALKGKQTERLTEWVTGGPYAVAVEVEAVLFPNRPGEPYLPPDTVRYLERLAKSAQAGDVEALRRAGTVYVRLDEPTAGAPSRATDGQRGQ